MTDSELIARSRELADRCEAATGPDRALDDAIFAAMGFCKHTPEVHTVEIDGELDLLTRCAKCGSANVGYRLHRYSSSLDAALTLVPEDYHTELRGLNDAWFARVDETVDGATISVRSNAVNAALAICVVALRARAQEEERKS